MKHFHNAEGAMWTLEGFVHGYGGLSDELAFRTAIHAGVQLLQWYNRRDPLMPPKGTPGERAAAAIAGRDFILRGWAKDKAWFENSALAALFTK